MRSTGIDPANRVRAITKRILIEEIGLDQIVQNNKVAVQRMISGTAIGSSVLNNGILGTVSSYSDREKPVTANAIEFAGNLSAAGGYAGAVVENAFRRFQAEIYERRLAKKYRLPRHMLEQRLIELDKLESELKAM